MTKALKYQRSEPKIVHQNPFYKISLVQVNFGDFRKDYYVSDFGQRVGVLLLKEGQVLLTRQYRFVIDDLAWEIPGGAVDEDETVKEAALRECYEETGVQCRNLEKLISYQQSLDIIRTPTHIFYTDKFVEDPRHKSSPDEVAKCQWVDFEECFKMIDAGEIVDGFTVLGLMTYKNKVFNKCQSLLKK